jgi:hypothetical protein
MRQHVHHKRWGCGQEHHSRSHRQLALYNVQQSPPGVALHSVLVVDLHCPARLLAVAGLAAGVHAGLVRAADVLDSRLRGGERQVQQLSEFKCVTERWLLGIGPA